MFTNSSTDTDKSKQTIGLKLPYKGVGVVVNKHDIKMTDVTMSYGCTVCM